jgi:ubiquitin-protein ligase
MTSETDQLAHDFAEVNKKLAQYPQIYVAQTEGDPPATYEIEYQLNALTRQGNGSIDQTGRHRLRIDLPFGYPHFPPTVKPLTPLFHPDIDPDAVRIASHWQQNPSLADLIVYIGEMICAQEFNLDEPFNQEAADWYSDHATDFPLDEIQKSNGEDESIAAGPLSLEKEDTSGLSLETEAPEEDIQVQLEEIQHHIDRNEVVTAGKLLTALSSSSQKLND